MCEVPGKYLLKFHLYLAIDHSPDHCLNAAERCNLTSKLMASGDLNVNRTFGGIAHQGCNIVFHKMHQTKALNGFWVHCTYCAQLCSNCYRLPAKIYRRNCLRY